MYILQALTSNVLAAIIDEQVDAKYPFCLAYITHVDHVNKTVNIEWYDRELRGMRRGVWEQEFKEWSDNNHNNHNSSHSNNNHNNHNSSCHSNNNNHNNHNSSHSNSNNHTDSKTGEYDKYDQEGKRRWTLEASGALEWFWSDAKVKSEGVPFRYVKAWDNFDGCFTGQRKLTSSCKLKKSCKLRRFITAALGDTQTNSDS